MTTLLQLALYMSVLTFVAILLGAILRNREWTAEGLKAGLSNRDQLPTATALGARGTRGKQYQGRIPALRTAGAGCARERPWRRGPARCTGILLVPGGVPAGLSGRHHLPAQRHLGCQCCRPGHDAVRYALTDLRRRAARAGAAGLVAPCRLHNISA